LCRDGETSEQAIERELAEGNITERDRDNRSIAVLSEIDDEL